LGRTDISEGGERIYTRGGTHITEGNKIHKRRDNTQEQNIQEQDKHKSRIYTRGGIYTRATYNGVVYEGRGDTVESGIQA
jgi:hypothetical protein